ncbi:MAG TPA: hypothetical protein VK550_34745 [Polyangiaceae bacterium]|nr:hypothetical protein [Polyangiaceae bacterium]
MSAPATKREELQHLYVKFIEFECSIKNLRHLIDAKDRKSWWWLHDKTLGQFEECRQLVNRLLKQSEDEEETALEEALTEKLQKKKTRKAMMKLVAIQRPEAGPFAGEQR